MIRYLMCVLLQLAFVPALFACELERNYVAPTILERVKAAANIAEATYESKVSDTRASYTVRRWLKGDGAARITVNGFGFGPDCKLSAPKGRTILFLSLSADRGQFMLDEIGPFTGALDATLQTIEEVQRAVGVESVRSNPAVQGTLRDKAAQRR